ncbi:MAG: hypothetical protein WC182_04030 [Bacilli bacterium]
MSKLAKFHMGLLCNGSTFLAIGVTILLVGIGNLVFASQFMDNQPLSLLEYQRVSSVVSRIAYVLLMVFLWNRAMSLKLEQSTWLLVVMKISRRRLFMSKLMILLFINFILGIVFFFLQTIVGMGCDSHYYVLVWTWWDWLSIVLGGIVYGMYTMALTQWWGGTMALLVPVVVFIVVHNLAFDGPIFALLQILFVIGTVMGFRQLLWIGWVIGLLGFINYWFYLHRDLTFIEK